MAIKFLFPHTGIRLSDRKRLKSSIQQVFKDHQKELGSIDYIFCTDEFLLDINRRFLDHDYYTDIITFNLADPGTPIAGEIYISIDRVKENARTLTLPLREELHRIIFHGALHLCGLNDHTQKEKIKMTIEENRYLDKYFN